MEQVAEFVYLSLLKDRFEPLLQVLFPEEWRIECTLNDGTLCSDLENSPFAQVTSLIIDPELSQVGRITLVSDSLARRQCQGAVSRPMRTFFRSSTLRQAREGCHAPIEDEDVVGSQSVIDSHNGLALRGEGSRLRWNQFIGILCLIRIDGY